MLTRKTSSDAKEEKRSLKEAKVLALRNRLRKKEAKVLALRTQKLVKSAQHSGHTHTGDIATQS